MPLSRRNDALLVQILATHLEHLHLLLVITCPSPDLIQQTRANFHALLQTFQPPNKGT